MTWGKWLLLGNWSTSLLLLLPIYIQPGALQPPLHPCCVAPLVFPARGASGEPCTHNMVNRVRAPLGRAHSPIMPSGNIVFLAHFLQLTKKSIANPSMQQYLELNKIEKVRVGKRTVHDERKRLHLSDSALTSQTVWFNLLSPPLCLSMSIFQLLFF